MVNVLPCCCRAGSDAPDRGALFVWGDVNRDEGSRDLCGNGVLGAGHQVFGAGLRGGLRIDAEFRRIAGGSQMHHIPAVEIHPQPVGQIDGGNDPKGAKKAARPVVSSMSVDKKAPALARSIS